MEDEEITREQLDSNILKRIPANFHKVKQKKSALDFDKLESDDELILFELPKDYDKKELLTKMKISKFGKSNGKLVNLKIKKHNYHGIVFDSSHYIPKQTFALSKKRKEDGYCFKTFDRYVKVFENHEIPEGVCENIIPRRRSYFKNSLGGKKKRKRSSNV
jgi:hypothetical protein